MLGVLQARDRCQAVRRCRPADGRLGEASIEAGVVRRPKDGLRILGQGELTSKVTLTVNHATASARAAIEKAGGTLNIIEQKVLAADVAKREKSAGRLPRPSKIMHARTGWRL